VLGRAIEAVARDLARQQAADGEGAGIFIECGVTGATDDADARAIARAVIGSALVKTAVHGHDPNWGRILAAAGNARLPTVELLEMTGMSHAMACARAGQRPYIDGERLRIAIAGTLVFDGGQGGPVAFDRDAARAAMESSTVSIRLDLGLGDGMGEAFGCDLTEQYVIENSEYTT
jgi:glutamate N-acetyltransferase/amino-acid N-acetyltransferase